MEQNEFLEKLRHSTAHVMAQAVLEIFPEGKLAFGPPIEDGFYYDFDLPRSLTLEDLPKIEARMREIIKENYPFVHREVSVEEARKIFAGQPYKLEQIERLSSGLADEHGQATGQPVEKLSIYTHDSFTDLCRGPHLESTGQINPEAIKLLRVAGAYWLGDERNPMLQRIYGTAWLTKEELDSYLLRLEEIERRDHRRLGRELDLYSTQEIGGAGLIYWHPKGALVREIIENFWREEHRKRGYDILYTPHIGKLDLWKISGHWDFYRENMYSPLDVEGVNYLLKPMNCPFAILIYKSRTRSYRELPLRWGELGTVYRYERSGVLHGLLRVRGFTQDDAHIFCRPEQLQEEILGVLELSEYMLGTFGFTDYIIELSVRDPNHKEKYIGGDENWQMAEEALRLALESKGLNYTVMPGEAKFYGPAVDIKMKDALGRGWQGPTIQVDFNLAERFDVNYVAEDGRERRVVMVHRTILGSMERFMACLVEHYAGAFPVWLAPVQAVIIPIADRHVEYGRKILTQLKEAGLRAELDDSSERMQAKIRQAQLQKIPYMLIVGDQETKQNTVSLRLRTGEDLGPRPVGEFLRLAQEVIAQKRHI